jgi:hypothetical protein
MGAPGMGAETGDSFGTTTYPSLRQLLYGTVGCPAGKDAHGHNGGGKRPQPNGTLPAWLVPHYHVAHMGAAFGIQELREEGENVNMGQSCLTPPLFLTLLSPGTPPSAYAVKSLEHAARAIDALAKPDMTPTAVTNVPSSIQTVKSIAGAAQVLDGLFDSPPPSPERKRPPGAPAALVAEEAQVLQTPIVSHPPDAYPTVPRGRVPAAQTRMKGHTR